MTKVKLVEGMRFAYVGDGDPRFNPKEFIIGKLEFLEGSSSWIAILNWRAMLLNDMDLDGYAPVVDGKPVKGSYELME